MLRASPGIPAMNELVSNAADTGGHNAAAIRRLLHVAWVGALLGLGIEVLLLAIQAWQNQFPDPVKIGADTVQKMTWSSLVCAAIAAGQSAARMKAAVLGAAGLLGAPVAFLAARSAHKAMLEALGGTAGAAVSPWLLAGLKGVEYALLGLAVAWLMQREAHWKAYALVGAAIGVVFYIVFLVLLPGAGDPLQRAIIEIVQPTGCALAVYGGSRFYQHLATDGR
jgi:hypothetical protein